MGPIAYLEGNNDVYLFLDRLETPNIEGKFVDFKGRRGKLEVFIEDLSGELVDIDKQDVSASLHIVRLKIDSKYFSKLQERNIGVHLGWCHFNISYVGRKLSAEDSMIYCLLREVLDN